MNRHIVFRLIIYFAAIMSLAVMNGLIAYTFWWRDKWDKQLSEQMESSLQFDARLRNEIPKLYGLMVGFAARKNTTALTEFHTTSERLDQWLKDQQPILSPQNEKQYLHNINIAYANYLAAAGKFENRRFGTNVLTARLDELADMNKYSTNILFLSGNLYNNRKDSISSLQEQNLSTLNVLRYELVGAVLTLVAVVYWLAAAAYRELVASLQGQLVESRRLVERQEKLASLGLLAAGVAHEIRNPLTSIKTWLYLQKKRLKPGTPEFSDAELIGGEINRLERIVRDFLQLARPSEPEFAVTPADHPLREVQMLMNPQLEKSGINIVLGDTVSVPIRIDPQQIKQVLLNLIQNAADSIGQNGTITLGARLDEKRINGHNMDVVILEVADTGKGIPPEAEKRLFDPFFTTKENGTGLGLPIAARIVEKHQGELLYHTKPDHGTTFGIILPRHES